MCLPCVYQLEKLSLFRKQCRKTDAKYRLFLRKVKSKKIERLDELSDDDDDDEDDTQGTDGNLAFVEDYEKRQLERKIQDQLQSRLVCSRKEFLEQVKATLVNALDSLSEGDFVDAQKTVGTTERFAKTNAAPKTPTKSTKQISPTKELMEEPRKTTGKEFDKIIQNLVLEDEESEDLDGTACFHVESDYDQEEDSEEPPTKTIAIEGLDGESVVFRTGLIHNCKKCGRKFATEAKLQKHSLHHEVAKPSNVCSVCGKCFSSSGCMLRHQKTHADIKPFNCQVCNRGFTQKTSLERHMNVHQDEKPFPCEDCDRKFTQKDLLAEHKLKAHSDVGVTQVYMCTQCPKVRQGERSRVDVCPNTCLSLLAVFPLLIRTESSHRRPSLWERVCLQIMLPRSGRLFGPAPSYEAHSRVKGGSSRIRSLRRGKCFRFCFGSFSKGWGPKKRTSMVGFIGYSITLLN